MRDDHLIHTDGDLTALSATVNHVRDLAIHTANLRTKNFNFFILLSGLLFTGQAKLSAKLAGQLGWAGATTAIIFLALDYRGAGLLRRHQQQMQLLEPILWDRAAGAGEEREGVEDAPDWGMRAWEIRVWTSRSVKTALARQRGSLSFLGGSSPGSMLRLQGVTLMIPALRAERNRARVAS